MAFDSFFSGSTVMPKEMQSLGRLPKRRLSEGDRDVVSSWVADMADWKVFANFTFRHPHRLFEAAKDYERFMERNLASVSYFYAVEQNPNGDGGHHIHGLWADCDDVYRQRVHKLAWSQMGYNRVEPIRVRSQVEAYCVKYVIKDNCLTGQSFNSRELWTRNRK
jgi:hypothetical protein